MTGILKGIFNKNIKLEDVDSKSALEIEVDNIRDINTNMVINNLHITNPSHIAIPAPINKSVAISPAVSSSSSAATFNVNIETVNKRKNTVDRDFLFII